MPELQPIASTLKFLDLYDNLIEFCSSLCTNTFQWLDTMVLGKNRLQSFNWRFLEIVRKTFFTEGTKNTPSQDFEIMILSGLYTILPAWENQWGCKDGKTAKEYRCLYHKWQSELVICKRPLGYTDASTMYPGGKCIPAAFLQKKYPSFSIFSKRKKRHSYVTYYIRGEGMTFDVAVTAKHQRSSTYRIC